MGWYATTAVVVWPCSARPRASTANTLLAPRQNRLEVRSAIRNGRPAGGEDRSLFIRAIPAARRSPGPCVRPNTARPHAAARPHRGPRGGRDRRAGAPTGLQNRAGPPKPPAPPHPRRPRPDLRPPAPVPPAHTPSPPPPPA